MIAEADAVPVYHIIWDKSERHITVANISEHPTCTFGGHHNSASIEDHGWLYFPCHIRVLACFRLLQFQLRALHILKLNKSKQLGCCGGGERGLRMDRTCRSETAIPGALLCGGIQCFDPSLALTKRIAQGTATASGGQTLRGNCPLAPRAALHAALHAAPRRTRLSYVEHIGWPCKLRQRLG